MNIFATARYNAYLIAHGTIVHTYSDIVMNYFIVFLAHIPWLRESSPPLKIKTSCPATKAHENSKRNDISKFADAVGDVRH